MGKRLSLIAVATMVVLLSASAKAERYEVSTGVGYDCTANAVAANRTLLVAGEAATSTLRIVPKGASSVIAGWSVDVGPGLGPIAQQLVVFEPLGEGAYRKVGESKLETLTAGTNSVHARIPVRGGESVGLFGPDGTLVCNQEADAVSLRSDGSSALGGTMAFEPESGVGTPLRVSVQPDADGDGYGDYGQDRCPGEASRESDCPIGVRIGRTSIEERAILVPVTSAAPARIEVRGEFRWQSDGRAVGVDRHTPRRRMRAGRTDSLRVPLPPQVLRRLDRLPPDRALAASLEIFITDRDGWESERRRQLSIRGRG